MGKNNFDKFVYIVFFMIISCKSNKEGTAILLAIWQVVVNTGIMLTYRYSRCNLFCNTYISSNVHCNYFKVLSDQ